MRFPCIGFRGKNGFLRRRGKGVEGDPAGRCSRHVPTKFRSRAGQQRPSLRSCRPGEGDITLAVRNANYALGPVMFPLFNPPGLSNER